LDTVDICSACLTDWVPFGLPDQREMTSANSLPVS